MDYTEFNFILLTLTVITFVFFYIYDVNYEFVGNELIIVALKIDYNSSCQTACLHSLMFQFLRLTK